MNELTVAIIGALAGGITGFFASRFSNYLDNRGEIIIETFNDSFEYFGMDSVGFRQKHEKFNDDVKKVFFSFSLEIRNPSKIRKDYKNGKLIIRSQGIEDEVALLFYNNDSKKIYTPSNSFQNAMMEPLEVNINRLISQLNPNKLKELQGKKVKFHLSITDSKNKVNEVLINTYGDFLNC